MPGNRRRQRPPALSSVLSEARLIASMAGIGRLGAMSGLDVGSSLSRGVRARLPAETVFDRDLGDALLHLDRLAGTASPSRERMSTCEARRIGLGDAVGVNGAFNGRSSASSIDAASIAAARASTVSAAATSLARRAARASDSGAPLALGKPYSRSSAVRRIRVITPASTARSLTPSVRCGSVGTRSRTSGANLSRCAIGPT